MTTAKHVVPQPELEKPHISRVGRLAFPMVLVLAGVILLALFLSILRLNNGTFIYTMDDPYISLALSDQVRHGNYGINAGLHAAPCSSILPPLLLVAASGTPIHPYFPLILNCLATFATLVVIWRFLVHLRLAQDTFGWVAQAAAVLLMAVCFNLLGVVFTGLEHSLHIAATAICIYGVTLFLDRGRMPAWLPAVIVICPLLRYEGLALSVGALLVLALRGRWRTAAGTLALIVLFVGSFSVFLVSLKLPPLSSSILSKSTVVAHGVGGGAGFLRSIFWNAMRMIFHRESMAFHPAGFVLFVIGVAAAVRCLRELPAKPWRWTSQGLMALLLVCLIGGQAAAGQFAGFYRYEDYALLGAAMMGIYLTQERIRSVLSNKRKRLTYSCATAVVLLAVCSVYIRWALKTPIAANNIYEQQFQMHRFISDFYRGPVAVNDLGLTSYHNPNLVLDLGGLGSEEARLLMLNNANADAYREIVARYGIHLVIIFDEWFPHKIPASWVKVASMDQSRECVACAESEVQFYATDAFTASKLWPELQSFKRSLPPRVRLTIYNPQVDTVHEATNLGSP